jgi:hypothetical protein
MKNLMISLITCLLILSFCLLLFGCGVAQAPEDPAGVVPVCLPTAADGSGCGSEYQAPCDYFTPSAGRMVQNPAPNWNLMCTFSPGGKVFNPEDSVCYRAVAPTPGEPVVAVPYEPNLGSPCP